MKNFLKRFRREGAVCLLLVLAVWGVFGQTIRFGFVDYDDPTYVYDNPDVLQGVTRESLTQIFTRTYVSNWQPLTMLSYLLDAEICGAKPGGYHLTNILLHMANAVLLFLVLRSLTGSVWRSAFVAALFAIHPLRVESVVWIAERKDVLSGLFFMLTLGAYARYARGASGARYARMSNIECRMSNVERDIRPQAGRGVHGLLSSVFCPLSSVFRPPSSVFRPPSSVLGPRSSVLGPLSSGRYWLVLALFACGLMAKPMLVTLPCVLLLLDWWPLGRFATGVRDQESGGRGQGSGVRSQESEDRGQQSAIRNPQWAIENLPVTRHSPRLPRNMRGVTRHLLLEKFPLFVLAAVFAVLTFFVQRDTGAVISRIPAGVRIGNGLVSYVSYIGKTLWPDRLAVFYPYDMALPVWKVGAAGALLAVISGLVLWQWKKRPYLLIGWLWYAGMLFPVSGLAVQAGSQSMADRYTYLPAIGLYIMAVWGVSDLLKQKNRLNQVLAAVVLVACAALTSRQIPVWKNSEALFGHALRLGYESPVALNNLAWLLAVGPDETLRNGIEAVALAEKACQLTGGTHPGLLDTLAAAYAEAGRFAEAVQTAEKAAGLARAAGNEAQAGKMEMRIELYRQEKPFRQ